MAPPQKKSCRLLEKLRMLFPVFLMNIHLKQTEFEAFKNKARSYRIDRNWRIFTGALKYVSQFNSYKKK